MCLDSGGLFSSSSPPDPPWLVCVTINANLVGRTSRPNCQACSGRLAGNWRGHSRESIYFDKMRIVSGNGRQEKAPLDPYIVMKHRLV